MEIAVIGTGYVGLVTGTCFAELGIRVTCIDQDSKKIQALSKGEIPIFEPGLEELVRKNLSSKNLTFTTNKDVVTKCDGVVIAVGTPSQHNGDADLSALYQAVEDVTIRMHDKKHLHHIIIKSTVPIGTAKAIATKIRQLQPTAKFEIISNPEFLREGSAVTDFLHPDRIVVGCSTARGHAFAEKLYSPLTGRDVPLFITDNTTAEFIKYASNSYLAMRIGFINEMADLAEAVGADVTNIAHGMGMDARIGKQYLHAGPGFGGSCFPKDTAALAYTAHKYSAPSHILDAVVLANKQRKHKMAERVLQLLVGINQPKVAVLGLAFKAETDDMRESPSIDIINSLIKAKVEVHAYDPAAMAEAAKIFPTGVHFGNDPYSILHHADAVVIVTEWPEFRLLDLSKVKQLLRHPYVIDLRNIYSSQEMKAIGFHYISIGRAAVIPKK